MTTQKVYPEGLLGRKVGMTQLFTDDGKCVPVTVIEAGPCYVLNVKKSDQDGYGAVQFGFVPKKAQRVDKALSGHFSKAGRGAFEHVKEVRCDADILGWDELGKEVVVGDVFETGELVDVCGTSIGRGFSGVVRRYNVRGQPATRGTHEFRRHIGSIGCRKFPGRVWKNQKMPGRHGGSRVTVQNLKVMGVMPEQNVILIKGCVPGHKGALVVIKKSMKSYRPKQKQAA